MFALGNALENSLALSSSLWGPFWAMEPLPGGSSGEVPKPLDPASLSLTSPTPHFSHPLHLPPLPCFSAQGPVVPPTAACGPPGCSEHHKQ